MRIIQSFLVAAVVAVFSTLASAQSLYDPLTGGLYGAPPPYSGGSVADSLNRQQWELDRRRERDWLRSEIEDLESQNRRLRALRAQERDRQRRYDPASGIWSPARSQ